MEYFYITWVGIMSLIWLYLYRYQDTRKEMLTMSLIFGFAGPIGEMVHIRDYWRPATITGTPIGIEDFLIGFFIGGIAAVSYSRIFQKNFAGRLDKVKLLTIVLLMTAIFFTTYLLGYHSFYACVATFTICTGIIWIMRKDLIHDSINSGLIMLLTGTMVYLLLTLIFPGFIQEYWLLPDYWFSYLVMGIPIAEYIWYFQAGMLIGPMYEFCQR